MNPTIRLNSPAVCATLTFAIVAGCSGEVLLPGSSGAASGSTGAASSGASSSVSSAASSSGAGGDCVPSPDPALPEAALREPTSGVFVDGVLHLSARLDQQPEHYLVLKIVGGKGYVVNQPIGLDGPANLAPIDAGFARGRVWATWSYDYDLHIFDVSPAQITKVGEYLYNPDGVHHYGPVLGAASDGERLVLDPGNDSETFLYTVGSATENITHAYFGLAGPKRLLAVVGKIAYLATTTGVRAYDITSLDAPELLDFHADAPFGEGLAALMASDATQLAVADADGLLYVVPLGSSGPVAPLHAFLGEPPAPGSGTCGGSP